MHLCVCGCVSPELKSVRGDRNDGYKVEGCIRWRESLPQAPKMKLVGVGKAFSFLFFFLLGSKSQSQEN